MKTKIVVLTFVLALFLSACSSSTASSNEVATQVAATIAAGQTATLANNNQVGTQVAETIAAGQTATAAYAESLKKTPTVIVPSATSTLLPSPKSQSSGNATQTPKPAAIPATQNTDAIAGSWSGIVGYSDGHAQTQVNLSIKSGCSNGSECGTIAYPQIGCSGSIILSKIKTNNTFVTIEQITSGGDSCTSQSGGSNALRLLADGKLSINYYFPGGKAGAYGTLSQ